LHRQDRNADRGAAARRRRVRRRRSTRRGVFELAWLNSHFETGLKSGLDDAILAHGTVDATRWRKLDEVAFDFERRRVSVLLEREADRLLIVKGARRTSCA
jgi:magnesium-transporting ATPase (P-type)